MSLHGFVIIGLMLNLNTDYLKLFFQVDIHCRWDFFTFPYLFAIWNFSLRVQIAKRKLKEKPRKEIKMWSQFWTSNCKVLTMNIQSSTSVRFLGTLVFVLHLLAFPGTYSRAEEGNKSVLYINSYHNGYRWSDSILEGIRDELGRSSHKIDFQIEYMDAKKFDVESIASDLRTLYKKKFEQEKFDVVIVSDDDAFNFARKYRDEIFPGTPLIFCGVNDLAPQELDAGNLSGVVENFDFTGTIDVAMKFHPERKRMVVVGDNSTTGLAIKHRIEELVPAYRGRLDIEYWIQLDLEEVQKRVEELPKNTFLFIYPYYQVIEDRFYTSEEVMAAIYPHSSVPIYTSWEFLLGHGAVGGSLISGFDHGQKAARMALEILDGKPADSIPVQLETSGVYLFDYLVMKQLDIDEDLLPVGSKMINVPNPFYELSHELFWTIMISVLLLFITVIFLIVNMMARRQGELKIKNQLAFQEILIDTIPQLVSWKDVTSRYMGANRTFADFFGVKNISEVINMFTEGLVSDENYVQWSLNADAAVVSGQEEFRRVRRKIIDSSGGISWLEVNKVPLLDQRGKINGILTTAENVTREQNLENQLLQSQKMEAIGTLAGGIAHDFNNILTSIINSTELAVGDVEAGSQTEKDLRRVLKAARRGGRVVKQILAFSKPTQDGFRSTNVEGVISEVIHLMEVSLPGNIVVRSHIAPNITNIHADPTQLHQAVMNLCTNSFHALRDKGGELELKLEAYQLNLEEAVYMDLKPGSFLLLTVADSGTGIPQDLQDKIFDPFFSSKDKSEGTGLGLTVVHGIVKGHGGGVRVYSEMGKGTVFEIFLPKIDSPANIYELDRKIPGNSEGCIIFVEDDEDQLLSAPRILNGFGYAVEAVSDSGEAAALIAANPVHFDLMITDYDMPGMNGVELVKMIKQWAPDLPVIMVSGREEAVVASQDFEAIKKVLKKPYDKTELQLVINSILKGVAHNE